MSTLADYVTRCSSSRDTGAIHQAWSGKHSIVHHPDTGVRLVGARSSHWDDVLDAASWGAQGCCRRNRRINACTGCVD